MSKAIKNDKSLKKDNVFIDEEVNRYKDLNEKIRQKINGWLTGFGKKRLTECEYIKKKVDEFIKNVTKNAINRWKTLKVHTLVLSTNCDKWHNSRWSQMEKV